MPSRARQEAAYEPAGPPPITSTEVWEGTDIFVQLFIGGNIFQGVSKRDVSMAKINGDVVKEMDDGTHNRNQKAEHNLDGTDADICEL